MLVGSSIGEDAALIDFFTPAGAPVTPLTAGDGGGAGAGAARGADAERLLVAKTDPITFASDLIGWYAVHVNANDIACAGATPRWFLASALLPERWQEADVEALFVQLGEACTALGVTLVGGHTEVTGGLDRPVVVGCMLGEVARAQAVRTGGGQTGDDLILTGGIAIEGTAVLAREAGPHLTARGVPPATLARASDYLFTPGISVVRAAQVLCAAAPCCTGCTACTTRRRGASPPGCGRWPKRPGRGRRCRGGGDGAARNARRLRRPGTRPLRPARLRRPARRRRP